MSDQRAGGLTPMEAIAIISDEVAIVPNPVGEMSALPLLPAVHLAWQRLSSDGALLVLFFGVEADRGVVTTLTRDGIRSLIADLRSIDEQLSDPRQSAGDDAPPAGTMAGGASPAASADGGI